MPEHLLLTSALTYEITGHLLILLHPAHIAELQKGVHVVRVHLKQQLQKNMSLITRWHKSLVSHALCLGGKLCKRGREANVLTPRIRERSYSCPWA